MNQNTNEGNSLRLLAFVRRAAVVTRYHTEDTLKKQSVGEHSFNVAWLCYLLTNQAPMSALIIHALAHDVAEHATGDVPSPTKRALGIRATVDSFEAALIKDAGLHLPPLDDHNAHILKLADALDGVLFCLRERDLGNREVGVVFHNYVSYVREELQLYHDKWADAWGAGAEYVETTALSILIDAEERYKFRGEAGRVPVGRNHMMETSQAFTEANKDQ